MKKLILLSIIIFGILSFSYSQINIRDKIKRKSEQRADRKTDQTIDKGLDEFEDGIESLFKKKDNEADKEVETSETEDESGTGETREQSATGSPDQTADAEAKSTPELMWSKYDFVPGDKIIFEDNLVGEENGEFPSRWDLFRGNAEIAKFGGEKVIMFRDGNPIIVPYIENSDKDYLPDIFTVEFDLYVEPSASYVHLWDKKNQRTLSGEQGTLDITHERMVMGTVSSYYPSENLEERRWVHVSIAYTKGKFKAYMDDVRLINIPRLDVNPTGISISCYWARNDRLYYIKNIRIAKGGVKYYDRVLQDGKIIASGIRFDVGKATLKPESMGVINEIYDLMEEHSDLKFSVEGHTDSDGDNASNQKLSEDRARTVMDKLVSMGISKDRLTSKGWGESNPIDMNGTAEGKANNRRVEFVKL
ncbi:MAG: OmpA family protein [Bacteroidales bacterium]|nr:MAG: OmpA family protein [Bacteroidales bacterium]